MVNGLMTGGLEEHACVKHLLSRPDMNAAALKREKRIHSEIIIK